MFIAGRDRVSKYGAKDDETYEEWMERVYNQGLCIGCETSRDLTGYDLLMCQDCWGELDREIEDE